MTLDDFIVALAVVKYFAIVLVYIVEHQKRDNKTARDSTYIAAQKQTHCSALDAHFMRCEQCYTFVLVSPSLSLFSSLDLLKMCSSILILFIIETEATQTCTKTCHNTIEQCI